MMRNIISAMMICLLAALPLAAQTVISIDETQLSVNPHMVGFNQQQSTTPLPWGGIFGNTNSQTNAANRRAALIASRAAALRYPGGTVSSYWNMPQGRLFTNGAAIDIPNNILTQTKYTIDWVAALPKQPNTIQDFKFAYDATAASPQGAIGVVFVMNMLTPGADFYAAEWGRTVDQTPGSADWWLMMDDRLSRNIAMLDAAVAAGIPVRYIEFGNEYYFGTGPAGTTTIGATVEPYSAGTQPAASELVGAFPDIDSPLDEDSNPDLGKAYAFAVNNWAPRLIARYPGVRLSAVGSDGGGSPRRQNWNTNVVSLIDKNLVPAVSFHIYGGISNAAAKLTGGSEADFAAALTEWQNSWQARRTGALMPADREFWFTEYAAIQPNNAGFGTWGLGLQSLYSIQTWLAEGNLGLTAFHQFAGNGIIVGNTAGINATGRAFSIFSLAAKNSRRGRRLDFENVPRLAGSDIPALYGWAFDQGADNRNKYVIVNHSGAPREVDLSTLGGVAGRTFTQAFAPLGTSRTDPGETTGTVTGSMILPPYSITVFEGDPVPPAPLNVTASAASFDRIDLTWNDVANETGYEIDRSLDGQSWTQIAILGENETSYSDTGLSELTTYYYRLRATNAAGDSPDSATVSAQTLCAPPVIANVSVDKPVLRAPNHKMEPVTVSYQATSGCAPITAMLTVTSSEPVDGTGDGDTAPDWEVLDATRVLLRAERSGAGSGRIYTITITATDSAGGTASQTVTVTVPRDAR